MPQCCGRRHGLAPHHCSPWCREGALARYRAHVHGTLGTLEEEELKAAQEEARAAQEQARRARRQAERRVEAAAAAAAAGGWVASAPRLAIGQEPQVQVKQEPQQPELAVKQEVRQAQPPVKQEPGSEGSQGPAAAVAAVAAAAVKVEAKQDQ